MVDVGSLAQRVLRNAAKKLGGEKELAAYLGVSAHVLQEWLAGKDIPPTELILRAVDLLVDEPKRDDADRPTKRRDKSSRT